MKSYCYITKHIILLGLLGGFGQISMAQHQPSHSHAGGQSAPDTTKKSIKREVHAQVGNNHFMMHYYAPAVRGRVIWGGLVAYEQVWVTGAHQATSLEFEQGIRIGSTYLPAGKYAFFTIPDRAKWTVILNKNWEQHLTDEYDAKDDVLRLIIKPRKLKQHVERLEYHIVPLTDKTAELVMRWERLEIRVPLENE